MGYSLIAVAAVAVLLFSSPMAIAKAKKTPKLKSGATNQANEKNRAPEPKAEEMPTPESEPPAPLTPTDNEPASEPSGGGGW